jgi:hypothetical protein
MSTFLDKNKKKSSLAALLLFLKARKSLSALLLLVLIASFLFVSPSYMLINLPGGARLAAGVAWIAGKLGADTSKWGLAGGKRDYSDLVAAFKAAKDNGGKAGWSSFMRGGDGSGAGAGSGSLDFVKGDRKDLESASASGEKLPKSGSVDGVLNPDDAKDRAEGNAVAVNEGEVGQGSGLVKSAFAGGFAGGGAGGAGGFGSSLSGGAFASKGFFGGDKSASSGKLSDRVNANLANVDKAAIAKGVQMQGGAKGQMSKAQASRIDTRTSKGMVGSHTISGQRAFVQLAVGRGRAAISVAPNCTPGSGCPGEFAATNTGAVYDGNTLTGERTDILSVPQIDGISTPNVPDTSMADDYVKDAEKMEADAQKCRELDDKYGPEETRLSEEQQRISDQFASLGCDHMSCSKKNKSKLERCAKWGDDMKAACVATMDVRCKHMHECPLTAGNRCSSSECGGKKGGNDYINQDNGCMDVLEPGESCKPGRVIHSHTMD